MRITCANANGEKTMAKRYFRVTIHGYGGEIVLGRLTEEQYDFWEPFEEEQIIAHAMWDPYEESDENPIYDDEDPRWLGQWYECDDIEHVNGADADSAYVTIEEVSSAEYDAKHIADVVETMSWNDFKQKYEPKLTENVIDLDEALYPNGFYEEDDADGEEGEPKPLDNGDIPTPYVFFGMSAEKGTFGLYPIETDGEDLDIGALEFYTTQVPQSDNILELVNYKDQEIYNDGGDTNGKGYYAQVWDW